MEQPGVDEVEEHQTYVPSNKYKKDKYGASITFKKILTQLTNERNQGKMWLRKPTHVLSPQKIRLKQSTK